MRDLLRSAATSGLLTVALLSSACTVDHIAPPMQGTGATLRVINAGDSPLSVDVDGTTRLSALAPASVSGAIDIAPGARRVALHPAAGGMATVELSATAARTSLVELHPVGASGLSASAVADTGAVPAAGMSKLRVLHLAAGEPAVDIWRVQPDYPSAVRLMFPFPLGAASSYVQSTPGSWTVLVTTTLDRWATGSSTDPAAHAIAQLSLAIAADQARTVVFLDDGTGGVKLVAVPE